ncbi:sugar transferase [Spirosoma sp.]|uniref:sugar transferase n=1 Tax=Spirosoma sp. TaxID=1899569 RepID=UPI003B3AC544
MNQSSTALHQLTSGLVNPSFTRSSDLPWFYDPELAQPVWYATLLKRSLDVVGSLLVTVFILSWLVPVLGVLILWESPGPIFFIQRRSGKQARAFHCIKFRTMYHVPQTGFEQTRKKDTRITQIGSFLRRTNLDEMPQFLNVLLGQMSLVGPRPHALAHDAEYWESSSYRQRYWVKPGITGLAQVRGNRGDTRQGYMMAHRIRYDHFYIKNYSPKLDIAICTATLRLMLRGDQNAW